MNTRTKSGKSGFRVILALLPLVVFLGLALVFYKQLAAGGATSELPSALIGKPAPVTDLPALEGLVQEGSQLPGLNSEMFAGKITFVNVFASWCVPCRQEHPQLMELARDKRIQLVAINYKDTTENALRFLGQLGNPFSAVGVDPRGRATIDWGVYGVPETYLVGPDGIILYKHVGPILPDTLNNKIKPWIDNTAGGTQG